MGSSIAPDTMSWSDSTPEYKRSWHQGSCIRLEESFDRLVPIGDQGSCPRLEESFGRLGPIREVSYHSMDTDTISMADSRTTLSMQSGKGQSVGGGMSTYSSQSSVSAMTTYYLKQANDEKSEKSLVCSPGKSTTSSIIEEIDNCCTDCGRKTSRKSRITNKERGKCENEQCDAFLCRSCKRKWVLLEPPSRNVKDQRERNWKTATFKRYCQKCYMKFSTIDFNCHSEVVEPMYESQCSKTTIIFTHREGWSRASFRPHAKYLAEKYGHKCILMDYAGHGSRWYEECTLDNCVKAVSDVLVAHNIPTAKEAEASGWKTIFTASSWGGLMAYHVLAEFNDYFSGVILDSCFIDVSSTLEKLRRKSYAFVMKRLNYYNQVRLQRAFLAFKDESYIEFFESNFAAGNFAKSGILMKKIKVKNLKDIISEIKCPVLFFNGTKNRHSYGHKKMNKIINLLESKEEAKVALFDGGDNLISHDLRFFNSWVDTAARFIYYASILRK